jgi:hypothetical protein
MERQQAVAPTDCEPIRTQFVQLLSGALDADSREQVRTHILSCRACTLAFGQATADSMTPELTAKFSRPMPRPPQAALSALGVQQARAGTVWTNLQTLAAGSSAWAKAEWENLRASMQQWLQELVATPQLAFADRAVTAERERQLEIPLVDAAGQPLGRTVRCEIMQPPAVTTDGEFVCLLRSNEPGLRSLRCTVTIAEEVKVTFTGEWGQAVPSREMVLIRAPGLPPPVETVMLPMHSVKFEVVV